MDAAGDPMVYSKIFLENAANEVKKVGRTDANGFIEFDDLTAGIYYLHIENHNNSNALMIDVGENKETSDLTIQFKDGNLVNGINDRLFEDKFNFNLYPTSFSDKLIVSMNLEEYQELNFTLLDINGQKVLSKNYKEQLGEINIVFTESISNLSNGVYFLDVSIGTEKRIFKVVKK